MNRVLVVEDDDTFRDALLRALSRNDFDAHGAQGVVQAEESVRDGAFDYAVVDLHLEDGSGIDVVRIIGQQLPGCRTVVLTGHGTIATAVEAMRAGAVDFLTKPVSTSKLVSILHAATTAITIDDVATLEQVERAHIERVLAATGGNVSHAAQRLGVHRRTLQRKLQRD